MNSPNQARLGKFRVGTEFANDYRSMSHLVTQIGFVPIVVNCDYSHQEVEYIGLSNRFELVSATASPVPEYAVFVDVGFCCTGEVIVQKRIKPPLVKYAMPDEG